MHHEMFLSDATLLARRQSRLQQGWQPKVIQPKKHSTLHLKALAICCLHKPHLYHTKEQNNLAKWMIPIRSRACFIPKLRLTRANNKSKFNFLICRAFFTLLLRKDVKSKKLNENKFTVKAFFFLFASH